MDLNTTINGRADDGPTLNAGLKALFFSSIAKKPYIF